jgi:preprotein translocase subunit SecG
MDFLKKLSTLEITMLISGTFFIFSTIALAIEDNNEKKSQKKEKIQTTTPQITDNLIKDEKVLNIIKEAI